MVITVNTISNVKIAYRLIKLTPFIENPQSEIYPLL